jgi:hypothetical protein
MRIDGSVRSNLLSAISSARRWRGRPVHKDTIGHWQSVLEHGRRAGTGPFPEAVGELVAELELELNQARACNAKGRSATHGD